MLQCILYISQTYVMHSASKLTNAHNKMLLHLTLPLPLSPSIALFPFHHITYTSQFCLSLLVLSLSPSHCLSLTHTHTSCPTSDGDGRWQLLTWWHGQQPPNMQRGKSRWNTGAHEHTALGEMDKGQPALLTRSHLTLTLLSACLCGGGKTQKEQKER